MCSLEVWDDQLARVITPGKWKFAGRQRFLDCLKYIAKRYGPNRACSSFVVGLEPVESFLEAARDPRLRRNRSDRFHLAAVRPAGTGEDADARIGLLPEN